MLVESLCSLISNRTISDELNSERLRISPSKFFVKTVLPAPTKTIFGIVVNVYGILGRMKFRGKYGFRFHSGWRTMEL